MIDRPISLAAAGFVISGEHRYALQKRGFAGAVLADDDGDGAVEAELEIVVQKGKAERIGLAVGDTRGVEPDPLQVGCRQVDIALLPRTHGGLPPTPDCEDASLRLWHMSWNTT